MFDVFRASLVYYTTGTQRGKGMLAGASRLGVASYRLGNVRLRWNQGIVLLEISCPFSTNRDTLLECSITRRCPLRRWRMVIQWEIDG